eukprot:5005376-Pyramimonas_sp.AAC.1
MRVGRRNDLDHLRHKGAGWILARCGGPLGALVGHRGTMSGRLGAISSVLERSWTVLGASLVLLGVP